jgi:uncharacterized protein YegP (UPF0339 family)
MVYEYWQNRQNRHWYWHLKAANSRIIADGAEGYVNKADCLAAIELVKNSKAAPVKEIAA